MYNLVTFHASFSKTIYALILIQLFSYVSLFAQDSSSVTKNPCDNLADTDPRQHVIILYSKKPSSVLFDTIYNWENRKGVPPQKLDILDANGEIQIHFNRSGLAKNCNFAGTVSLVAFAAGKEVSREIEIESYSLVGTPRESIGISSAPVKKLSTMLLNLITRIGEETKYDSSKNFLETIDSLKNIYYALDQLDSLINKKAVNKQAKISLIESVASDTKILSGKDRTLAKKYLGIDVNTNEQDVAQKLKNLDKTIRSSYTTEVRKLLRKVDNLRKSYIKTYELVYLYLKAFKDDAGEEGTNAVMSIINQEAISYNHLMSNIESYKNELTKINLSTLKPNSIIEIEKTKDLIVQGRNELMRFITMPNTITDTPLNRLHRAEKIKENIPEHPSTLSRKTTKVTDYITENRPELIERLSKELGDNVFRELYYATINIPKSGVKSGETIYLYLKWNKNGGASTRLEIGKYRVDATGWRVGITDMFALVERVNESFADTTTLSPSRFKGSGGAVLMWAYKKQNKPLIVEDNGDGTYKLRKNNRLINFFEPSIGINVSYLDFSTKKDIEVGTGMQLGLFENKIFLGYGVNLHMLRPEDRAPTYFFVGFSFAKLEDIFKTSKLSAP